MITKKLVSSERQKRRGLRPTYSNHLLSPVRITGCANNSSMRKFLLPNVKLYGFTLVLLFVLQNVNGIEVTDSTQHPFTLSTFVVPASTTSFSAEAVSSNHETPEAVTENIVVSQESGGDGIIFGDSSDDDIDRRHQQQAPTQKPSPVLYRHGKIIEQPRSASQDSSTLLKAQALRPHRLGLYPTELKPVFEPSSVVEDSNLSSAPVSLMETFMALDTVSSVAPQIDAVASPVIDPKDVRPTRTVYTPLVATQTPIQASTETAEDGIKPDKTVTLFGFVDFTTSLSGTKIIFKPTATRRTESPQEQAAPAVPMQDFKHLFQKSQVQSPLKPPKPSRVSPLKKANTKTFTSRSSVQSTQTKTEKFKTGLVNSKTGSVVRGGVTTEFTTLVYGTFIQGSYAHIIQSTSSIYATPTLANEGVTTTTMIGSETSVASVAKPFAVPGRKSADSEFMNSNSVIVLGEELRSVMPSPLIITEGFILPSQAQKEKPQIEPTQTQSQITTSSLNRGAVYDFVSDELESSLKSSSPEPSLETSGLPDSSMTSIEYVTPKRLDSSTVEPTSITVYTTYTHFTTMYNNGMASVVSNHEVISNVHTMLASKTDSEQSAIEKPQSTSDGMSHMILILSPSQTAEQVQESSSSSNIPIILLQETPELELIMPSAEASYDYTTYTYYTTFIKRGKTSVTSRTSVASNLATASPSSEASIVPTPSATLTEPATSTYYTTYTYYTTFFRRGSSRIRSREKVETNIVTIFPGSTITATTEVLTPITVYKDHSPVVSFAKVPKVYLTTIDERTETNKVAPTPVKVTTTFTFLSTTTDPFGNEVVSTSFSILEGLATEVPKIAPTQRVRTDFTTFTYFSTTAHPDGATEVNSRSEVVTRYVTEEPSRRKRDVQQKLETTFTDLVTTFDHGRPVISTRKHTVTLGTLHITDTVPLPAATRAAEPIVTRILEPALVREHIPIDPRPVDHTYYTTYTYYTTTLDHGVPITKTRYEVITQVRHIDATPGIPGILDRQSGACLKCPERHIPTVIDAYPRIAPSTHYPAGYHTAYSTLTFYTTHYPRGSSYVETRYSVVTNVATATVTNHLPGLRGADPGCPHHHTTFTYFTTRYAGPTATVDVQKETVAKCDAAAPVIGATRVIPEHVVVEERHRPVVVEERRPVVIREDLHRPVVIREDHRDHVHKPCTVCLPDYSRKTFYTTYTHYTTVLDNHGHPSVSTRYETYTDILGGVRPTRTRLAREATRDPRMKRLLTEDVSQSSSLSSSSLATGLITSFVQDRVTDGITTRFTTAISATYIRGFYAHIAQTSSTVLTDGVLPTPTLEHSILTLTTMNDSEAATPSPAFVSSSKTSEHSISENSENAEKLATSTSSATNSLGSSLIQSTGILSSEVLSSIINSDATTVWHRNVIGTFFNGLYAHIAVTSTQTILNTNTESVSEPSQILPTTSSETSTTSTPTSQTTSLTTGLLTSKELATEIINNQTVVLLSAVYGTYIGDHYAQYAKIERSTVTPKSSTPITDFTEEKSTSETSGPVVGVITSTTDRFTNNHWVTIQTVFTYGTYIHGYYAHIARTSTEVHPIGHEPQPTVSSSSQSRFEPSSASFSPSSSYNLQGSNQNTQQPSLSSLQSSNGLFATLDSLGHQVTPHLAVSDFPALSTSQAQIKETSASFPTPTQSPEEEEDEFKTGLLSRSFVTKDINGVPFLFTYDVTGTVINGFYAHIARTQSTPLDQAKIVATGTEKIKRPIITFHIKEPNDQIENQLFSDEISREIQSKLEKSLSLDDVGDTKQSQAKRTRPIFPSRRRKTKRPQATEPAPEPGNEYEPSSPPAIAATDYPALTGEDDYYDYDYAKSSDSTDQEQFEPVVRHQRLARAGSSNNSKNRVRDGVAQNGRTGQRSRPALLGRRRVDPVQSAESLRQDETTNVDRPRQRNPQRRTRKRQGQKIDEDLDQTDQQRRPRQRQGRRKINRQQLRDTGAPQRTRQGRRQQQHQRQLQDDSRQGQQRRNGRYNPKNNRNSLPSSLQPTTTIQKSSITLMSVVTTTRTLPIYHGYRTSYATITTTAVMTSVVKPTEYSIVEDVHSSTSFIDGEPTVIQSHQTKTVLNRKSEINNDVTTVTEVVVSTTLFEQVKTVPIQIGFKTRTDIITESSTLTQLRTNVQTIAPETVATPWSFNSADPALQQGNPYLQPNPFIGNLGQNLFANAYFNPVTLPPQYVTSTIIEPTTIISTSVVSVNLRGRKVLKTISDTKVTDATRVTSFVVQQTAAPQLPLITPQAVLPAAHFTTDITLLVTDHLGQARPLVTRVVLPIHHGSKVARSLNANRTPSQNNLYNRQQQQHQPQYIVRDDADDDDYNQYHDDIIDDIAPSGTQKAPPLTTLLKNDQSEIYQREAGSQVSRSPQSPKEPRFVKRRLLQFQQPLADPSSSYYLPQFTNYNEQPYASRVFQPSINNYYNPHQQQQPPQNYDFQQYQPYQPIPQNQYQNPYSEYPYEYHSQVAVPQQNDFHNQLAGFQQSFNPPPPPQQVEQQNPQNLQTPQNLHDNNQNQFSPLLSYDVNPPNQFIPEPAPPIEASRPSSRHLVRSSKLKRKTILRKPKPTPTLEFSPQTPLAFDTDSYVTPTRLRKSSVVRRKPQTSEYAEEQLSDIPPASSYGLESNYFILKSPSYAAPQHRVSSSIAEQVASTPSQFLFETAKIEQNIQPTEPTEKRRVKLQRNPNSPPRKAIVSSRVQKAHAPLSSINLNPITFYTTFTYLTTFLHGTHTVYQSRESVISSVHNSPVDPTLLAQYSNGYLEGSTIVPVSTRTRGLATTIVNLQSRLAVQTEVAPSASPVIEEVSPISTVDLQQVENARKTVYVLQTYKYTVVDELGEIHTSSKTEIKSSIVATPTAFISPSTDMSISNGFLALDNTRTVRLANDVRNGKTTKVDLTLRTVLKLENIGDAVLKTHVSDAIAPSSTVSPIGASTTAPTGNTRQKIRIKSIVRKRPGIQSSRVEPTEQLESSFIQSTPELHSESISTQPLNGATITASKQLKKLKVTIRKKASKVLQPTAGGESRRPYRASKIVSRRIRPSDLIRQSPVISITPVAFTTRTRLPIEESGTTRYHDVELTTFSLVTSTITPSFFPPSPQFTRPNVQASPVVLTYFTTTTYTIPVTRDGVVSYTTSEHTNSRVATQYPEPSSLQPSLVLDAALVNELQTPHISNFETKTMFTTYTYYTTFYVNGSTSVVSSLNVISNTVQVPLLSSLAPTSATSLTILKTSERLRVSTSYSTFTFYATLFNGTSSLVTPFEEVQSQVFTLTESFVVTRTVSIVPTSTAALEPSNLYSELPAPSQTSSTPSFTLFTLAPASTQSRASGPLVPSIKTFLTTFTYFTTFFRQSSSYVVSKESVVTSFATLFVEANKLKPTTTSKPLPSSTSAIDPRYPYTTYTSYTTYTFYTTLFGGKDKIVISSEQIVPQVVTKRLDGTNIQPTTTTSYATFTAPPVTEDLPSLDTSKQTPVTEFAIPTEEYDAEYTTDRLSGTDVLTEVTTSSSIPTVALPEIIIRDQKPTVAAKRKTSTRTSSVAITTLPYTQTVVLSSSTRFFGRDRSLTHIGAGSTLLLITGLDGLLTRTHSSTGQIQPPIESTTTDSSHIAPSATQPGTILDLTDILGGKGGKLGEAIKGIVNLFNTKNASDTQSASTKISREDTSLPNGPVMVSSQEPLFIPLSPVLDISSYISPASASPSAGVSSTRLTPVYKPDQKNKNIHIPIEKLMSDLSKAKTKILVSSPTVQSQNSKRVIPSTTIKFEDATPAESVSVIVGAETIFFDEGASTHHPGHPEVRPTATSSVVVVTPEVEIAQDGSQGGPGYVGQAQSSVVVLPSTDIGATETLSPEGGLSPSKPTIYFQVSSTAVTESPSREVDYGGVKVFIAGRGSRKPVEPVIKPETTSQSTRRPLPNIFKVGNRKPGSSTTSKPVATGPKVKISFPKPPTPTEEKTDDEDLNDIFNSLKPFNNNNKENIDGPTPTPLCYPACDSSRHEACVPNLSKTARNKYICVCKPGFTRDPESTSNICIASQTYLLPVRLIRANQKGSIQSQMPRLLHALKVSLEQTYSETLGFPKGSLLDAKVNSVEKTTSPNNKSSIVLTLSLSQRATNADISLPLLSTQLARTAPKLNSSLEQLQSPFVLLGATPLDALKDLDECSSSDLNDCSAYSRCINVPGSFHCECKSGYQDLDTESPGRICSSEIKNCQFCSARGSCILGVDNGVEKTTCRCNTMYLGRRCEINGLVLTIALPIALSLLTLTICCSIRRCRPKYRTAAVKPPLPHGKMAMVPAYPGAGSLLASSDKGHSDKTQMISDSSSEGETSHGGDHWSHHHHHPPHHHHPMDGRHTQMSSGGYSGYGDSLADTLATHHLPSIVIPRVRPKLPVRQR